MAPFFCSWLVDCVTADSPASEASELLIIVVSEHLIPANGWEGQGETRINVVVWCMHNHATCN